MTHPRVIAMRRRVARIRRLVAACAVAAFIALFAAIYVQMATGHDPVLGTSTATASASTGSSDSAPSAVTTRQS
jgi:hypothetical protein